MRWRPIILAALLPLLLAAAPARQPAGPRAKSPPVTAIHAATHEGFGRVVVMSPSGQPPTFARDGERILVDTPDLKQIPDTVLPPRNVRAIRQVGDKTEIILLPDRPVRIWYRASMLIIDTMNPLPITAKSNQNPGPAVAQAVQATLPLPPLPPPPEADKPAKGASGTAESAGPQHPSPALAPEGTQPPADVQVRTVATNSGPPPASASGPPERTGEAAPALAVQPFPEAGEGAVLLPFEPGVGAAAFRRGDTGFVVFDQRVPLDLAYLRANSAFAGAQVRLFATGTLIQLPLPPAAILELRRHARGWVVVPLAAPTQPRDTSGLIAIRRDAVRLLFATSLVGHVLSMADPESGATLLIGTVRQSGPAMAVSRQWALFRLSETWLGLVVEPLSDSVRLRPVSEGFALSGDTEGLALGDDQDVAGRMARAPLPVRRFDFPLQSDEGLLGLRRAQLLDAATTPPLARGPKRRALGQTLIALGLAAEAQTVLQVAAADDPREADNPDTIGLTAIAALLAGRLDEAAAVDDPRLGDGGEIRLWRAVRRALQNEGDAAAARELAATLSWLSAYPDPLRQRLLPLVAETLALGGQADAARGLLEQCADLPGFDYARALLALTDDRAHKALEILDRIARGRDRLVRARAAVRAVEIRMARGELNITTAAAALEKRLYAWRGDARDFALRLRVAELQIQAGAWRPALALLRDTAILFPDQQAVIDARLRQSVAQLLHEAALERMPPLELVTLVDENAELMPEGPAGLQSAARLADRLIRLDLPGRAGPVLQKLMATAPTGPSKARFGARLAAMRLEEGDAQGARAALDASVAAGLGDDLAEERSILAARAQARLGDPVAAVAELANLDSEAALRARATISEEARNWPQAAQAVQALATRLLPPEGPLTEAQQRLLLRLTSLAAQAGDTELLERLRDKELPRMSSGPVADLLRLLTAAPVQGPADLPRAGKELALARALAADRTSR